MNGHALEEAFIDADAKDYQDMATDFYETYERGHGRVETRRYWTLGALIITPVTFPTDHDILCVTD
jgi:hypothetical protein